MCVCVCAGRSDEGVVCVCAGCSDEGGRVYVCVQVSLTKGLSRASATSARLRFDSKGLIFQLVQCISVIDTIS